MKSSKQSDNITKAMKYIMKNVRIDIIFYFFIAKT